jgi:hypothetical protein
MTPTQKAAMEQALAKLEHLRVTIDSEWGECRDLDEIEIAGDQWQEVIDLRAALAEQDVSLIDEGKKAEPQEPVAWGIPNIYGEIYDVISPDEHARMPGQYTVPLYAAPQPRREPLTDEQIEALLVNWPEDGIAFLDFARAIEAAHGITGETK